jgi:hypothetical protein
VFEPARRSAGEVRPRGAVGSRVFSWHNEVRGVVGKVEEAEHIFNTLWFVGATLLDLRRAASTCSPCDFVKTQDDRNFEAKPWAWHPADASTSSIPPPAHEDPHLAG